MPPAHLPRAIYALVYRIHISSSIQSILYMKGGEESMATKKAPAKKAKKTTKKK